MPANLPARLGLADLRSNDPVRPLALARLHRAFGAAGMDLPGPVTTPWAGLAGAWGVRWLVAPASGLEGPATAGWQEVYANAHARIYRNTRALGEVRLAGATVALPRSATSLRDASEKSACSNSRVISPSRVSPRRKYSGWPTTSRRRIGA